MPRFYSNSFISYIGTNPSNPGTDLPNIRSPNKYAYNDSVATLIATLSPGKSADSIYVLAEGITAMSSNIASGNLMDVGNNVKAFLGTGTSQSGSVSVNFTGSGKIFQVLMMNRLLDLTQTNSRAITSYQTTRSIRDSYVQEDLYGTRTLQLGSSKGAKRNITYTIWQSGIGATSISSGAISVGYTAPSGTAVMISVALSGGTFNSNPVSSSNTLRVTISGTAVGGGGLTENLTFTSPNQTLTTTNSFQSITSATLANNGGGNLSLSVASDTGEGAITNARNELSRLYDIQREYPNFILWDLDEDYAQDYRAIFPAYWIPGSFSESIEGNQVIQYSFAVEER